jgi:hypothetical protein
MLILFRQIGSIHPKRGGGLSAYRQPKSIDCVKRERAPVECQSGAGVVIFHRREKGKKKKKRCEKREMKGSDTYADHPNKGGRAQTSPKHQAKMRRPLARLRVILREYCIGRTMAKYLVKETQKNSH